MFTGLIESVGRVLALDAMPGGVRLRLETALGRELTPGDSLATNGVCLTVVAGAAGEVTTEVSPETLRVTSFGQLKPGSLVNLERPLRPDSRMGGHFVQGHVDCTGTVKEVAPEGEFYRFTFTYPPQVAPLLIPKGSIAVDGISLTVAALRGSEFDVQIIPHTWQQTNMQALQPGDVVNLECDMLGKYVVRIAELMLQGVPDPVRSAPPPAEP
jgi:riboflavin synthase alpha subunit